MPVSQRKQVHAENCSVVAATTITLDGLTLFNTKDTHFNLIVTPVGSGTGTLTPSWACGQFPDTFIAAVDDFGAPITIDLSQAISVISISNVDLFKLKLTPSGIGGSVTGFNYSLVSVG